MVGWSKSGARRLARLRSPKGVNFTVSVDDAVQAIKEHYSNRWFGASLLCLSLHTPLKEFLPFYFARGHVNSVFVGHVTYTTTPSSGTSGSSSTSKDAGQSTSTSFATDPIHLKVLFSENKTQVYGGFKYHITHVNKLLQNESSLLHLEEMKDVFTDGATINLFEQSGFVAKRFISKHVELQVREVAMEKLKQFHPNASSLSVTFSQLDVKIEEITPVFLPCYVVKATYDGNRYTIYVSGSGAPPRVEGPYLIDMRRVARVTSLTTVALFTLLAPVKPMGLLMGAMVAIPLYYVAYYAAKYFPRYYRDRNRRQREALRNEFSASARSEDVYGSPSKPLRDEEEATSERVKKEYRQSSYWDTHRFQQRATSRRAQQHSSSSSSSSTEDNYSSKNKSAGAKKRSFRDWFSSSSSGEYVPPARGRAGAAALPADPKHYYRALGLRGDESVNEIRSAYRQVVLKAHPDVGGSTQQMFEINKAYQVLRDPSRRAAYDVEK